MRLSRVLWCAVWAWAWRGLPWAVRAKAAAGTQANECELYGGQEAAATASPVLQFQRRVTIGLMPQAEMSTGQIILHSSSSGETCNLYTFSGTITVQCGSKTLKPVGNSNFFNVGDVTDLWLDVVQGSGDKTPPTWELRVVERRGRHRAHLLVPDTLLQPPVNLRWEVSQNIFYYFNCITGCLFQESVQLPKGDHTFFLRHDEDFIQMTLDCSTITPDDSQRELFINVTADELGPPGGLKEITVVWSPQLGRVGVLVDGAPVGVILHEPLRKERQVNVTVSGGGGGLVAACDPRFQAVAGGDNEGESSTTSPPDSGTTNDPDPSTGAINHHHHDGPHHDDHANQWLPATFTLVLLNLIVTLGAILLGTSLYFRSSEETTQFSKENSGVLATFSRRLSTRSSTRSQHRGSQRRNKDQNEASPSGQENADRGPSGVTRATSETATTPLTTPDPQAGQRQKVLSTDSLVNLELI